MPLQYLLIALATFASEDLTCIATGVLISQGHLNFFAGTAACLAGIFFGDLALYAAGRLFGQSVSRWIPPGKLAKASEWIAERGPTVILLSRFTPGLRLPTYLAAGFLRTRFWQFSGYFLFAAAAWTPLLVGATVLFGEHFFNKGIVLTLVAMVLVLRLLRSPRLFRWEFWPMWAAYVPLIPYFVFLAIKHRSFTVFTLANPGIPLGGLTGESKADILTHLSREPGAVADFALVSSPGEADEFMMRRQLKFPVVLKPDVGERGSGVAIIRNREELEAYLGSATGATIMQRYIAGVEFGLFYCRFPGEANGKLFSITHKTFPSVTGDGYSTLAELIQRDSRASCIAASYKKSCKTPMQNVPAAGERVQLVEIGSHCRGAIFLDGGRYRTQALEESVDRVSKAHPGFYFGRYDVRTPSVEALQRGIFSVIELNGVASEATHIYDPAVSVWEAYRVMFQQWALAFEIGARNREAGGGDFR
ncbi:MAG: VTT domain-containing protein [Bryobacteraceae bacterium]